MPTALSRFRRRPLMTAAVAAALVAGLITVPVSAAAAADPVDLARFGVLTASSEQNDQDGTFPAGNANDGDPATRWSSENGPDEDVTYTSWLQADLGALGVISSVGIAWEAAYAAEYEVQTADGNPDDPTSWTTRATENAGNGGTDVVSLATPVTARYVRLNMLKRTSFDWDPGRLHWYGYSVFSFEVSGTSTVAAAVFTATALSTPAGEPVQIPIALSAPAPTAGTVHIATTGGTAVAGTDYTPVDADVSFAAGASTASVTLSSVDNGPLAPATTVELTLSAPTGGVQLGLHTAATVRLLPHGDLPGSGRTQPLATFEDGTTGGIFAWSGSGANVGLSLVDAPDVPGAGAGNHALQAAATAMPAGSWGGFSLDIDTPADWSDFDGFSFAFLGTGSGSSLRYELKSGGATAGASTLFETSVVDDTVGWRTVKILFADLRVKGNPSSSVRFDPAAAHGFAVTLSDLGVGNWTFDTFALYEQVFTIEDFEGDVTINPPSNPVGFFPWGNIDTNVNIEVTQQERDGSVEGAANHVLSGTYLIPAGGWGGFSDNLAASQDWSKFGGLRFWWYASQDNRPASPTAGDDIVVELKDDGPDAEHTELWKATFKDNWSTDGNRWKLVELPFSSFVKRGDYQPGPAPVQDGLLSLTRAWGFALTMPPAKDAPVDFAVDQFELYGSPAAATGVSITATSVTLVDGGETGTVDVTVKTTNGDPLPGDVTVAYAPGAASDAVAGTDFQPFEGTLTFPAGTESGTAQQISVETLATPAASSTAKTIVVALIVTGATAPDDPRVVINAHGLPYLDPSLPTAQRVDDLLGRMTQAEKIGQMTQAERLGLQSRSQISTLRLGSLLSGGGSVPADNTPAGWADMIDGYQTEALSTPLQVPLIYGVDAVHGHNNVVGATIFPHNIGLGASRDPGLVRKTAEVTATEVRATGIPWTFAPCLCVTRDERWGRSYESFSEDPTLVSLMAGPAVRGFQGSDPTDKSGPNKVLATIKHWVGDGGTEYDPALAGSGYPIDQGITKAPNLSTFRKLHIDPYIPAIRAGAGSLMPSYSAVQLGSGPVVRMHENKALNTDLLKGELGFSGFLISDWEGIDKLSGPYADKAVRSVNAGLDMAMAPYNYAAFIDAITGGAESGTVTQARIDDAVRRILTQKVELGLFESPFADRSKQATIGSAEHRAVARQAAVESQVLLKNSGNALPLSSTAKIYLAGSNADDLGRQMGGWSISWQGGSGQTTTGTTIRQGMAAVAPGAQITYSADASAPVGDSTVGVVVVGEPPYAEGQGDVGNNGRSLDLPAGDRAAIDKVCSALPTCVVLVVSGRPQLVGGQLGTIDALVASWLPGTEGAGVADVLFGKKPFTGRLPVTWPAAATQVPINVGDATYAPQYPYGWGLRTDNAKNRVATVKGHLAAAKKDLVAVLATVALTAALQAKYWNADGSVRDATAVMALLGLAAKLMGKTTADSFTDGDLVVSVMRDVVQKQVAAAGGPGGSKTYKTVDTAMKATAAQTAKSDQQVAAGKPDQAAVLLLAAWVTLGNPR